MVKDIQEELNERARTKLTEFHRLNKKEKKETGGLGISLDHFCVKTNLRVPSLV